MPFGLSGAPASFQRLMNKLFRDVSFVTTYLDDILIHSKTQAEHVGHLAVVLSRLKDAGLTLRGHKCKIGLTKVHYLGHVFRTEGMAPDRGKVQAVKDWPVPSDASEVRQFLGLASYYRRYVLNFANIAAPLHQLTEKGTMYSWTPECDASFNALKKQLTQAPILAYPKFGSGAGQFVLATDASNTGIGAVLEQEGRVVAYASRTLSKSEKNYSVIQKECLAIVYATKQFRHYLLGRPFTVVTDHAPLQWLSAQKMEGLLCRWALALQEYDFHIEYKKGSSNSNADALSRRPTYQPSDVVSAVRTEVDIAALRYAQEHDPHLNQVLLGLKVSHVRPPKWRQYPLRSYAYLWSQLVLSEGVVYRRNAIGPCEDVIQVPLIPHTMREEALRSCHSAPGAGHQGVEKTLARLRQEALWPNMHNDVKEFCKNCVLCQRSKLPNPTPAPLTSMPIGRSWEMIAVDILEVPMSTNGNRYLMVVQDYFTKWAEAIPLKNQTAALINEALVKLCCIFGLPSIIHSDQGRAFESLLLRHTLDAFGIKKSRTTAYHPQGDGMVERFNRSLLQLLRTNVEREEEWECHLSLVLFAYRTAIHSSTGVSPFVMMFGRQPKLPPSTNAFDAMTYSKSLCAKLDHFKDFVDTHLQQAARHQKAAYDRHTSFIVSGRAACLVVSSNSGKVGSQMGGKVEGYKNHEPSNG